MGIFKLGQFWHCGSVTDQKKKYVTNHLTKTMAVIDLKKKLTTVKLLFSYIFLLKQVLEKKAQSLVPKKKSYLYQKPSCQDNQVKAKLPSFLACRALGIQ